MASYLEASTNSNWDCECFKMPYMIPFPFLGVNLYQLGNANLFSKTFVYTFTFCSYNNTI